MALVLLIERAFSSAEAESILEPYGRDIFDERRPDGLTMKEVPLPGMRRDLTLNAQFPMSRQHLVTWELWSLKQIGKKGRNHPKLICGSFGPCGPEAKPAWSRIRHVMGGRFLSSICGRVSNQHRNPPRECGIGAGISLSLREYEHLFFTTGLLLSSVSRLW